jgi:hypothetical protein
MATLSLVLNDEASSGYRIDSFCAARDIELFEKIDPVFTQVKTTARHVLSRCYFTFMSNCIR